MSGTVVWNAAGLSPEMTGIERLASAYTNRVFSLAPEVSQVFVAERRYRWLDRIHPSVTVRFVPHLPGTVAAPRWSGRLGTAAWHTWANPLVPRPRTASRLSVTVHDWTPFERGDIRMHHRLLWQAALLTNLASAGTLHFTTDDVLAATPGPLSRLVRSRRVLVGGDVPTLAQARPAERSAAPYVLAVGTLVPRKRLRETTELWYRDELRDQPRLVVAGRGTEDLGSGGRHQGLGYVEDSVLAELIGNAEAVVSLSDREGLNLPAREAVRAGVPVVGTAPALGTLAGTSGVVSMAITDWLDADPISRDLVRALHRAQELRRDGIEVATDDLDGDALGPYLVDLASRLAARGR